MLKGTLVIEKWSTILLVKVTKLWSFAKTRNFLIAKIKEKKKRDTSSEKYVSTIFLQISKLIGRAKEHQSW